MKCFKSSNGDRTLLDIVDNRCFNNNMVSSCTRTCTRTDVPKFTTTSIVKETQYKCMYIYKTVYDATNLPMRSGTMSSLNIKRWMQVKYINLWLLENGQFANSCGPSISFASSYRLLVTNFLLSFLLSN